MKRIKVWIATLSLLLAFTTMVMMPTRALADPNPDPQNASQPAPSGQSQTITWAMILALIAAGLI